MKVPVPWMREFVDVPADARQVATRLAACGFEVASVDDDVIDFEITANRPDCLSVYGLAREAATAFDLPLAVPPEESQNPAAAAGAPPMHVSIGDAGCGRYALAVTDVQIGPSPSWLIDRLTASGVRPINSVVDVANYVMIEMGHPMHAFDVAKLAGPEIRVRRARPNERLTTLDGQTRTLDDTMLVIADRDRAIAVAGVMGGADSEVSSSTSHIALESAWFLPSSVRATSRRLGLKTEASARFERGADVTAPVRAIRRALSLLEKIGAGSSTGAVVDVYPRPADGRRIALRRARIALLLGDTVPDPDVERILSRLAFRLSSSAEGWNVEVPAFRVDVAREADLIEEVGRHWGFDRIPATFPPLRTVPPPAFPGIVRDRRMRRVLCGAGLQEAATFTFIDRQAAEPFALPGESLVGIANPLSEKFGVLRPSLLPGLIDSLVYSRHRESADVRLFEIGSVFRLTGEAASVGWVLTGARSTHWSGSAGAIDFFDAKGVAELVAGAFGLEAVARAADGPPWFVRGRAARIVVEGAGGEVPLGAVGQLRPDLAAARGLAQADAVFGGELDPSLLASLARLSASAIVPLPRFPSIVRDVSIVVDERLPAASVRGTIRANAPATLVSVREFDRYQGKGLPDGTVSLSLRLTFRAADRTLTDAEVLQALDAIVAALAREHGAALRGK